MKSNLILELFYQGRLVYAGLVEGKLELGRLRSTEPKDLQYVLQHLTDRSRIAIAGMNEPNVSREHVWLEQQSPTQVRIRNISINCQVVLDDGVLEPLATREFAVPIRGFLGAIEFRVQEQVEFQSLAPSLFAPREDMLSSGPISDVLVRLADNHAESVVGWLESIASVLQSAVSSGDFYDQATQAMVRLIGLDSGCLLLRTPQGWIEQAQYFSENYERDRQSAKASTQVLTALVKDKRTVWGDPGVSAWQTNASLKSIQSVIAAPILNSANEVIGALYGDRLYPVLGGRASSTTSAISKVEAMLTRALASSVAAGLARVEQEQVAKEQEKQAVAARTLFGQFFTPQLSELLTADSDMLKGREAEVTLLFCDIRNFSGMSERLEPAVTVEWLRDVIGVLSDCVIEENGVLVDYIGDELMAMWGAPSEQPDQALLACRAAVKMHDSLEALNERWTAKIGERFRVGIGINSGRALVGNTGSHRKLKYGALGNPVNVASRTQGMTKHLGCDILVTGATREKIHEEFATRRLCKVRMVNLTRSTDLYELRPHADAIWMTLREEFEAALSQFESQTFGRAAEILGKLISQYPDDLASKLLLQRTAEMFRPGLKLSPDWDSSYEPPGK